MLLGLPRGVSARVKRPGGQSRAYRRENEGNSSHKRPGRSGARRQSGKRPVMADKATPPGPNTHDACGLHKLEKKSLFTKAERKIFQGGAGRNEGWARCPSPGS